jgi:hypothetical protein
VLRSWAFAVLALTVAASCGEPAADDGGSGRTAEVPGCVPGQLLCPLGCIDVSSNPQHCGACGMACAPGAVCEAGACRDVCGAGLGLCAGQCVSLQTSAHCGSCDNACQAGLVCVGGACSASCAGTICNGATGTECVSLTDDRNHCGTCNHACAAGDKCEAGQCVLDCGALTACDGACVDVLSDAAHCGSCTTPCGVDEACMQGACVCAPGKSACGESCVDTALDPAHCGGCDQACGTDGLCEAGKCLGPDGCTDTPVTGLALRAVDVYQSVQIPIMEEGTAVATSARNADVVAGRKALFRVHVAPDAGWTPREVSARIELTPVEAPGPDQSELFFAPLTPTRASSDDDESSTFQLLVPAESIGPDTRYAVTLVECAAATTAPAPGATSTPGSGARFPSTGYAPLEARETGPLKVHVVPLGSPGPDVSEQALEVFKERLLAVYPVTEVSFTVGEPLLSSATSMCSVLASISSRRSQDSPPPDVYYYGLTPGILGGQSGCSNASASASGSKVAAGWAQGFARESAEGAATMCHELGHSHGRMHAPCNVQDPDRNYPYPDAEIGVYGYDFRSNELLEPTRKDMMSYCPEPRWNAWISDYNYQAILERVIAVNALAELPAIAELEAGPSVSWRLLVSDSAGLHWVQEPLLVRGAPEGTPVQAVVHGESGPMQQITVYRQWLEDGVSHDAFMLTLPDPDRSWRAIEVPGLLAPQPLAFDPP